MIQNERVVFDNNTIRIKKKKKFFFTPLQEQWILLTDFFYASFSSSFLFFFAGYLLWKFRPLEPVNWFEICGISSHAFVGKALLQYLYHHEKCVSTSIERN